MPYFNYSCNDCGEEFEALTHRDGADVQCPDCDGERLTRQVGTRISMVTSAGQTGRVMDLSSGACPGCSNHRHH